MVTQTGDGPLYIYVNTSKIEKSVKHMTKIAISAGKIAAKGKTEKARGKKVFKDMRSQYCTKPV